MKNAKKGDPEAMYQLAVSLDKQDIINNGKTAYSWANKAAEMDHVPSQALVAFHLLTGYGVAKDEVLGLTWAAKSSQKGDGFATWLRFLFLKDNPEEARKELLQKAYAYHYPLAILYVSKLFANGSASYGIKKDEIRSMRLLQEAADYNVSSASAICGISLVREGRDRDKAFNYIMMAADDNIPVAMSIVASMFYNAYGTEKNEQAAYHYYDEAAALDDVIGIEGLADCYRMGIGVGQNHFKAIELYKKVLSTSPRAKYLMACYKTDGGETEKDFDGALSLLESSADSDFVFAQAILGISLFTGTDPCLEKDRDRSYHYLSATLRNPIFDTLPNDIRSKVYEYAAACLRYGFGTGINIDEADRLYNKSTELRSGISFSRAPFGLIGAMTPEETVSSFPPLSAKDIPDSAFDEIVLDYPQNVPAVLTDSPFEVDPQSISVADSKLEKLLVDRYDQSGDGKISEEELAAVSSIENLVLDNQISSFDEFAFFTSVTEIPSLYFQGFSRMGSISFPQSLLRINKNAFLGCSSLTKVVIPASVIEIGAWAFANCDMLRTIICEGSTPPEVGDNFLAYTKDITIRVPAESVETYKRAPGWSKYSKQIKASVNN